MAFHIISHDGTGGETTLVDGFNAAAKLKIRNPKCFQFLTENAIESEYIEEGDHFSTSDYIIKEHPVTQDFLQIRFNVYDRATLSNLSSNKILEFYKSYTAFAEEVMNNRNQLRVKLTPGTILLFDNWRIMHGREKFSGKRKLTGCYISRSDWLSKAKTIGLPVV